jgi:predicted dithiol-disulfide oxidoreductase (DUF899 family)
MTANALPPVVDDETWQRQLDELRVREKAATRELDAIAAQRRRMPMVKMLDYTLEGEQGPVRLADVFGGRSQLIVYHHKWFAGEQRQCPGCTWFTSQGTDRRGPRVQAAGREHNELVFHGEQFLRDRRRCAAQRRVRCQRVSARW